MEGEESRAPVGCKEKQGGQDGHLCTGAFAIPFSPEFTTCICNQLGTSSACTPEAEM